MAKVQNTLIGRASGSVGGATFTTWKGINVLKSKPESVANPRTLGQISQRNRLSVMVAVYRLIALAITIGFKTRAVGKSAYNAFVSANIGNATTVDANGNATVDYQNLKLALGTMGSTPIDNTTGASGQTNVGIGWDDSLAPIGSSQQDIAYGVALNPTTGEWVSISDQDRSNGEIDLTFGSELAAGDRVEVYLFFKSFDDADVSDSVYVQHVVA